MNIPETLENALRAGKVIPFAGAGVSMAVLDKAGQRIFPGWGKLLDRAAERLKGDLKENEAQLVRSLLNASPPDYLYAAQRAQQSLGPVLYDVIKEAIDIPHERIDSNRLDLASALWHLGSKLIVTTNYDRVLKWACPHQQDLNEWNIQAAAEQAELVRDGVPNHTIWYLHGRIDDKVNLILTPDGYSRLYHQQKRDGEQSYSAALTTLRALMASRTFLFVGFGMEEEVSAQLRGVADIFQGATGHHYVLVREAERDRIENLKLPLEVVPYTDHGEPLLALLRRMAQIAAPPIPPPIVASYDPRNKPFSVPYAAKGEQVIGRESQLQAVRTQLTQGRRTAIGQTASFQGLGGLGKTQLAVEYAWKYRDTYPNGVIWLNADQDMDAQLIDLSEKARWVARESDHKSKLDIALHRLKSYSDCLLIFDNLEEQETIRDYLPEPGVNPHILVTSRDEQPGFIPVPLELLDSKLSLQLLIQEAEREPDNEDEWQAARDIVSDLDGLPLALELAGAYLRHRPVSWAQYRDLRRQRMQDAILPKHLTFTRHDTDLYSTLRVSEELLDEQPRLRDILDLLTWSGSAPMGLSLLSALIGVENPVELTGALGLGVALRLLKKSAKADSYAIHRLLGEVRRAEKPLAEQGAWVDKVCLRLGDWFQDRREDFADLAVFEAEIDHLSAWQTHAAQLAPHHASRLIWLQTYPPYHRGRYQESQQWVNQAIEVLDRESTPSQELKAHLLADLGTIEGHLGKYEMALAHDREALAIRREVLDEKHPDTANSLNNVGSAYGDLGDHEKQLEYAEQALVVQREALGEKHPDTANSLNNVGNACSNLGRLEQAIDNGRQAVQLATELLGHQHPNTLLYIGNLAVRLRKSGQRWQAFQLLDKTLRDLPRDNPHFEKLAQQARNLLSGKQLRPGFRQPSAKEAERNWGRKK